MPQSLMDRIRAEQLAARKAGDKVAVGLLTALQAEAARVGKDKRNGESTDEEVVAVVRKFIGNAGETKTLLEAKGDDRSAVVAQEIAILERFMPSQMDAAAIEVALRALMAELTLAGPKAMGELMKAMKDRHTGRYDGATASACAKRILAG